MFCFFQVASQNRPRCNFGVASLAGWFRLRLEPTRPLNVDPGIVVCALYDYDGGFGLLVESVLNVPEINHIVYIVF
jgi:hypothetical protein